ncbi:unnamed protein product [Clonostachys rosea]|uniref:Alpha/beta hydrolase fold-3 domain-containing protein n=1 Tax=Bionectria ochroleuca TaxID=29856 RepID=A0ABY6UGQ8_BIOOC|nr:unnamed protein product [Clonostachys rosea]
MNLSLEELRQSNVIAPEMVEALARQPMPEFPGHDPIAHRHARADHLKRLRHLMPVSGPIPDLVTEEGISVDAEDGSPIPVFVYRPAQSTNQTHPVAVLFHEGGWSAGDATDEEFNARRLARDLGFVCLNVEYRLAPEHRFPTAISDSWRVVNWITRNSSSLGADLKKGFIVGGSSAGGHIAAIMALRSQKESLSPPITGQWLSAAYLVPFNQVPEKYQRQYISPSENTNDPVLNGLSEQGELGLVVGVFGADIHSPLFSPMATAYYPPAIKGPDAGFLAKAFIQVGGLDPLRDHNLIYEKILRQEHGVKTRVELYPGYGHMFWTNWPEMSASKKYSEDMIAGFQWLLS